LTFEVNRLDESW